MLDIIRANWDQILENMKNEFGTSSVAFNTWVKPLTVYSFKDNRLTLAISDENKDMMCTYIKSRYEQPLTVVVSEYFDEMIEVYITTLKELTQGASTPVKEVIKPSHVSNPNLNPDYTFDTFVVGKNNELAHATALAVAESPGEYANPLFIYGGVGLGKTHLMHSIAHYVLSEHPDYKVICVTTEDFSSELIAAIKNKTQEAFKSKYRNIDMLLIDDIQFLAKKDSTMEEFFHTFNALYDQKKQIVITADKQPKDIQGIEDRLISRFRVGLTVDIQQPDYDTRVAIITQRAEHEHINMEEKVPHYVAEHFVANIRDIEGALKILKNYAKFRRLPIITLDDAKEALKDQIEPDKARVITPEIIIDTVIEHYNYKISAAEIKGKQRSHDIAFARQICMYLCERYTNLSLAAIGKELGKRDHTTIMHGVKKIGEEIEVNDNLRTTIDIITKKLNPPTA